MDTSTLEYQESTSITFEWTLRDVKNVFESSKGDAKSKVIKSMKFGGGRWQVLFYANAGTEGGYVSLYLSCEPTVEEKERALDGKWTREGIYKFSFELRNIGKTALYNMKEAHSHSFSHKTANWGWAQFARRDVVYYSSNAVRQQDAILVICTINSAPTAPLPPHHIPRQHVPKDLLDTVGSLLDDPMYSDVEFILPRRGHGLRNARKIWAARKLLKRADYFDTMFSSGFAEASFSPLTLEMGGHSQPDTNDAASITHSSAITSLTHHFEDSDDEDDDFFTEEDEDMHAFETDTSQILGSSESCGHSTIDTADAAGSTSSTLPTEVTMEEISSTDEDLQRNVRAKLSHPSSPRTRGPALMHQEPDWQHIRMNTTTDRTPGGRKLPVLVRDVAYLTYRAVLYYIYTDSIVFAPLSSSFHSNSRMGSSSLSPVSMIAQNSSDSQPSPGLNGKSTQLLDGSTLSIGPTSRREWIKEWQTNHPGRPAPCSAKAAYRLADKLDLSDLKERASQHIIKSLTVENISYEVFSPFSAAFDEIRKIQVSFFLDHWAEIRASNAMRDVWQQIRTGRHPGFEEVWPVIASNLEFKPQASDTASGDKKDMLAAGDF